ncbi:MAG: HEAT repeat domain-containing protein [Candidatus Wallbacteria bacterium]
MFSSNEEIIKNLKSEDWVKRFIACKSAGDQKLKNAAHALIELLDDDNVQVRIAAVSALKAIPDKRHAEHLIRALADSSEWVRVHAVEALGLIGEKKHVELLSQFLENEESDKVRATLIKVLGELGGDKVLPVLLLYLKDKNARVRANSVEAVENLAGTDEKTIKQHLLPLLNDENNRVKANSIKALFKTGESQVCEVLQNMTTSKDDWMRASAAYVLGVIDYDKSVMLLMEFLNDECWFVVKNAVKALVKKSKEALPELEKALNSKGINSRFKTNIITVLGEIGNGECLKLLILMLNDENGDVRQYAEATIDKIEKNTAK